MIKSLLLLLLAAAMHSNNIYGLPERNSVGILDSDSFDEFISARENVLVLFVDLENEDSKKILDEFSQLAIKTTENRSNFAVVLVDVLDSPSIAKNLDFYSFPKVLLFMSRTPLEYSGKKESELIHDWTIQSIFESSKQELTSIEDIRIVSKMRLAVLVKFPKVDTEQYKQFLTAAQGDQEVSYFYTHIEDFQREFNVDSKYALIVFRNFDDGIKVMTASTSFAEDGIRQFVGMFKHPMIYPFNREVTDLIYTGNATGLFYFARNFTAEKNQTFNNFAFFNRHKIKIYKCEFSDFMCENLAFSVGHELGEEESVFVLDNQGSGLKRYKFKQTLTEENLTKFVDNFQQDLLHVYLKSEDEPAENNGAVKKVVRSTFTRKVINIQKTVILLAYAANPDSFDFELILEAFAKKYESLDTVSFAKIDVSKNEHDKFYVSKVPQLFVYKKKHKSEPVVYLGKKDETDVLDFLLSAIKEELDEQKASQRKKTDEL